MCKNKKTIENMKKVFSFFCFIVSAMMLSMYLSSCNSCSGGSDIHFIPETPDSTMYVRLDAVNGDTMNVVLLEDGTKMVFNFAKAKHDGAVHGQLNVGDSLAIMADLKTKSLRSAINLSEMKGMWMVVGGKGDGMRLQPDGQAVSIGNANLPLSRWKIKNGMLILTYLNKVKNGENGDMALVNFPDTSEIVSLTKDSLQINVNGKLYVCVRQTELMTLDKQEVQDKILNFTGEDVRKAEEEAREERIKELKSQQQ